MANRRVTFDVPGLVDRRRLKGANRDNYQARREVGGPTHQIRASDQRHQGDPVQQIALREPIDYEHPQRLGQDVVDPSGPRILPVSQAVQHGPQPSHEGEFSQGQQDPDDGYLYYSPGEFDEEFADPDVDAHMRARAHDLLKFHAVTNFNDRRVEGRRYRGTTFVNDLLGRQKPIPPADAPADMPREKFQRGW